MRYILLWFFIGVVGTILGSVWDIVVHHSKKTPYKLTWLPIVLGPFTLCILFKCMLLTFITKKGK